MAYRFDWDSGKAGSNLGKPGVTFDEASTVFEDRLAVIFVDEEHSLVETRELIIGHSRAGRLLLVSFVERPGAVLRLISARRATRTERQDYENNFAP